MEDMKPGYAAISAVIEMEALWDRFNSGLQEEQDFHSNVTYISGQVAHNVKLLGHFSSHL